MTHDRRAAITAFLVDRLDALVMTFDREGLLLEANPFAQRVLGAQAGRSAFDDLFVDFQQNLDLLGLAEQGAQNRLLHVSGPGLAPQTFYFDFLDLGEEILVLGRPDYGDVELMRRNLREMTGQLTNANRELQKKTVELTELNKLKNQFIGMAAHDLRNPLGQILNCSEILMDDGAGHLQEEDVYFLKVIKSASEFMLALIDELLDLSVIESGQVQLDLEELDFIDLIKRNIELNGMIAAKWGLEVVLSVYEPLDPILIDGPKIEQALNNLLSNAVKYSPKGSVIQVGAFATDNEVMVSVEDSGPGIPDKEIANIFKPFTKSSVKPVHTEKATGLGLAITQRIIAAHGGRIWVDSRVGRGSTFHFSLPIKRRNKE
jgi:signal transduction histidine kinase